MSWFLLPPAVYGSGEHSGYKRVDATVTVIIPVTANGNDNGNTNEPYNGNASRQRLRQ